MLVIFYLEKLNTIYFPSLKLFKNSISVVFAGTFGGRHEKKLLRDLMVDYDNLERPVVNESSSLVVTFGITLQQIIDVVSQHILFICLYFARARELIHATQLTGSIH